MKNWEFKPPLQREYIPLVNHLPIKDVPKQGQDESLNTEILLHIHDKFRDGDKHAIETFLFWKSVDLRKRAFNDQIANKWGYSCTHIAAMSNKPDLIELIHQNHGNLNLSCNNGLHALHLAARNGHIDAVAVLVKGVDT